MRFGDYLASIYAKVARSLSESGTRCITKHLTCLRLLYLHPDLRVTMLKLSPDSRNRPLHWGSLARSKRIWALGVIKDINSTVTTSHILSNRYRSRNHIQDYAAMNFALLTQITEYPEVLPHEYTRWVEVVLAANPSVFEFNKAMASPDALKWEKAISKEYGQQSFLQTCISSSRIQGS